MNNDQISSAILFFLGIFIILISIPYGLGGLHAPETGFVPFMTGSVLCLLSLFGFLSATIRRKQGEKWKSILKGLYWRKPLITMCILLVYSFLLTSLGFVLSTGLLVGFLLRVIIPQKWSVVVAGAILTPLFAYLVFKVLLKTELPIGFFNF
jgi:hypothetical protein